MCPPGILFFFRQGFELKRVNKGVKKKNEQKGIKRVDKGVNRKETKRGGYRVQG